jgi:hypothetical protein
MTNICLHQVGVVKIVKTKLHQTHGNPWGVCFPPISKYYYPDYQTIPTSITKMNEKSTNQNPQNCHLVLNKRWKFNFV